MYIGYNRNADALPEFFDKRNCCYIGNSSPYNLTACSLKSFSLSTAVLKIMSLNIEHRLNTYGVIASDSDITRNDLSCIPSFHTDAAFQSKVF